MDTVNRAGAFVVWIGLPKTRSADADAALRRRQRGRREGGPQARPGPGDLRRHVHDVRRATTAATPQYLRERIGPAREGARRRRRPLRARGRRHHRPRGAEAAQQGVRPDELAQEAAEPDRPRRAVPAVVQSPRGRLPDDRGPGGRDLGAVARARAGGRGRRARGLFRSDHYRSIVRGEPAGSLDAWATLARSRPAPSGSGSGRWSRRSRSATPSVLAKNVVTVDHVSGGRVELGIGAGWYEARARRATASRSGRSATASTSSTGSSPRSRVSGPRPDDVRPRRVQQPRPPIIVGGSAKPRTVAAAVRYADEYNTTFPSVDEARERARVVAEAARAAGRAPLRFSMMTGCVVGRDDARGSRAACSVARRHARRERAADLRHRRRGRRAPARVRGGRRRARDAPAPRPRGRRDGRRSSARSPRSSRRPSLSDRTGVLSRGERRKDFHARSDRSRGDGGGRVAHRRGRGDGVRPRCARPEPVRPDGRQPLVPAPARDDVRVPRREGRRAEP